MAEYLTTDHRYWIGLSNERTYEKFEWLNEHAPVSTITIYIIFKLKSSS